MGELALEDWFDPPEALCVLGEFLADAEKSRASLESKFALARWILSGQKLDRGAHPFRDFALLVRLRNELIHFRVNDRFLAGVTSEEIHKNLLSRFKDKNLLAERQSGNPMSWTFLVRTKAIAEWSCRTAAHMIVDLCRRLPESALTPYFNTLEKTLDPDHLFADSADPQ